MKPFSIVAYSVQDFNQLLSADNSQGPEGNSTDVSLLPAPPPSLIPSATSRWLRQGQWGTMEQSANYVLDTSQRIYP